MGPYEMTIYTHHYGFIANINKVHYKLIIVLYIQDDVANFCIVELVDSI